MQSPSRRSQRCGSRRTPNVAGAAPTAAAGNLAARTDANGHITSYGYDAANQLVQAITPLGADWRYGYDAAGNLTTATTAAGTATTTSGDGTITYGYDVLDRLVTVDFSDDTPTSL